MVKVCAVKSCPNGLKMKNRNNSASPSLSYFRPMTPKKLQNWRKSLGIVDLKSTDYICHLHFKKEDVTMFEKNKTNGEVQILKTGKTTLNDKALPSVNHQFTPTPEHKLARKPDSSCFQTQNSIKEVFVDQETDDPYMDKTEHFSDPLLDNVSNTTKTSQNIEKWVNNKKILKLPPTWMYVRKENRVEYERINLNTGAARNLVTFLPNNKEIILKKKIDSFKNIYDCLKHIERIRLCAGTRIHNKRYSRRCEGVIHSLEVYTACKPCRMLRNVLQERIPTD
ncbi:uncharacterized protein LOC112054391 isoform X2 [Bicyclus anynana]|uniref:Uncharacterized protein LOC112054391 isoform X2 n=1 Tax=Bicyclus anynana TaxID=110368 RepID=A0ABM3M5I1_BICAN|nr:uncharacterized protein LOC112054391 isoform X2 [Bicyclus anynana]